MRDWGRRKFMMLMGAGVSAAGIAWPRRAPTQQPGDRITLLDVEWRPLVTWPFQPHLGLQRVEVKTLDVARARQAVRVALIINDGKSVMTRDLDELTIEQVRSLRDGDSLTLKWDVTVA